MFLVLPYAKPAALPGTTGFHGNHLVRWAVSVLLPWKHVVLWVMGLITSGGDRGLPAHVRAHGPPPPGGCLCSFSMWDLITQPGSKLVQTLLRECGVLAAGPPGSLWTPAFDSLISEVPRQNQLLWERREQVTSRVFS